MKHSLSIVVTQALFLLALLMPFTTFAQGVGNPVKTDPVPQSGGAQPASQPATQPAPGGSTPANSTSDTAAGNAAQSDSSFVSLTQLPGISSTAGSPSLPVFFNALYKLCIGAAAVIAILQIMRAGVLFMTSKGSVTSNEAAKSLIQNSIIGLVLVLSPYIVFSLINPNILKLELNLSPLTPSYKTGGTASSNSGQFTGADTALWETANGDRSADAARCAASSGTLSYGCKKKDGSASRIVGKSDTCNADENSYNICKPTSTQNIPSTGQECQLKYDNIKSVNIDNGSPSGTQCSASNGYVSIPHGCCAGASATGNICCAQPKSTNEAALPWMWRFAVVNVNGGGGRHTVEDGPFASQTQCQASLSKWNADNPTLAVAADGIQCTCDKPKSEFGGKC